MQKQRLIYCVILKVMTLIAALILLVVFINSLFLGSNGAKDDSRDKTVTLNLTGMAQGEIRKIAWNGREVAVLKRSVGQLIQKTGEPQQLNQQSRSIFTDYFVFFNAGDSGHCPLFFNGKTLKDTCSGKRFDLTGRENSPSGHFVIDVPAHYFVIQDGEAKQLVIGRWQGYGI